MVAMAERSGAAHAGSQFGKDFSRSPERKGLSLPLPDGTFLDRLNTIHGRPPRNSIPSSLDLSVLSPHWLAVHTARRADVPYHHAAIPQSRGHEVTVFGGSQQVGNPYDSSKEIPHEVESGLNAFFDPTDNTNYSDADITLGTEDDLPLALGIYGLVDSGMHMTISIHGHPRKKYLPFFSWRDWALGIQQRTMGENEPLLNALGVGGDGVQVLAIFTDQSHPLLTD